VASSQLTFNNARQLLRRTASQRLETLGFRHIEELSFARMIPEGLALIHFSIRHGAHKELCFSFGVGVRFAAVEELLHPDDEEPLMPTVGLPASKLLAGSAFPEWCLEERPLAPDQIDEAIQLVLGHGIGFLDRYSSLSEVVAELRCDDPSHWFVLSAEERIATLVAIEFVNGQRTEAIRRLRSFLDEHPLLPTKMRAPLMQLHGRLFSSTSE
jgi:hypothetical protein